MSRQLPRASRLAMSLALLLIACEGKEADFFEPDLLPVSALPDRTPPVFDNFVPATSLGGAINTDELRFRLRDLDVVNGPRASGVDWARVIARVGTGAPLTYTRVGDDVRVPLGTTADGPITFDLSGSDNAGNAATAGMTLTLDRTRPSVAVMTAPPATSRSNAAATTFDWRFAVTDPHLATATGALFRPGADNVCGTSDDTLVPKGTGLDQASENSWSYAIASAADIRTSVTVYNPLATTGMPVARTYCYTVTAADNAVNATGAPAPNTRIASWTYNVQWEPLPPTTGTVRGTVRREGTPISGVSLALGTRSATTASNGTYEFLEVAPGMVNVAITPPSGTTCTPSVRQLDVVAGAVSVGDFDCAASTGRIVGQILIGTTPAAGVTVTVGTRVVQTDAEGRFAVEALPPGQYNVVLSNLPSTATCTSSSQQVTVTPNGTVNVNFTCSAAPGRIVGVATLDEQRFPNARIVLQNGSFRITDADGRYEFTLLAQGTYTMIISALPTGVYCFPSDQVVQVPSGGEITVNWRCFRLPTLVIATSYIHYFGYSEVCAVISAASGSLAGLPVTAQVSGPGVDGSGVTTVRFDAQRVARIRQQIYAYGLYAWIFTIAGQQYQAQTDVTGAAGTCAPP